MKTDTYRSLYGATQRVYPYDGRHTHISAESFAFNGEPRSLKVNWPSIGGVSIEEARQFAAAYALSATRFTNNEMRPRMENDKTLLAAAEAREVGEPDVCKLAAAEELDMLAAHVAHYVGPDDARDDIKRICYNRAKDLRREAYATRESPAPEVIPGVRESLDALPIRPKPTAAEVIEAAEKALWCWQTHVTMPTGPTANYGAILESLAVAKIETDAALVLCARWKEARNAGK